MQWWYRSKSLICFVVFITPLILAACGNPSSTGRSDYHGPVNENTVESTTPEIVPTVETQRTTTPSITPEFTPTSTPIIEDLATQELLSQSLPTATFAQLKVIFNTVNVRAGPGTDYAVIQLLYKGDVVPSLEMDASGSWHRILLDDGSEGWVGSTVVEILDELIVVSPVNTSEPADVSTEVDESDVALPTSTPFPSLYVEVYNTNDRLSSTGNLWLFGEAVNLGSKPVKRIKVTGTLYDQAGLVTAVDYTYADIPLGFSLWHVGVLHPGEYAPFSILIRDPGQYESWRITAIYTEARETDFSDHYDDLLILNDQGRVVNDLLGNYRIAGEIQNIGSHKTGPVRIVSTLYDSEGRVIGVDFTGSSQFDELGPGETTPFSVLATAYGTVASYRLFIRSVRHD
jgi:hypothetical protein